MRLKSFIMNIVFIAFWRKFTNFLPHLHDVTVIFTLIPSIGADYAQTLLQYCTLP